MGDTAVTMGTNGWEPGLITLTMLRLTDYNSHSIRCRSSFLLCVVQIKSNYTLLNNSLLRRKFPMSNASESGYMENKFR